MAALVTAQPVPYSNASCGNSTERTVTILLATFAGLGLPRTLSLPVDASASIQDVLQVIDSRLPDVGHSLIITTTDNKQLLHSSTAPISTLLSHEQDTFLPLRLSARLCGGKGGFGSQLRAAGGRMSSRKKRDQNQNANGSSRNLDGRRIRTVAEAKKLGEVLAKADKVQKEEEATRKKELEDRIEDTESKLELLKSGRLGGDRGRLDAQYVESKEAAQNKTTESVMKGLREGTLQLDRLGGVVAMDLDRTPEEDEGRAEKEGSEGSDEPVQEEKKEVKALWGFDEEDDSEDDEEDPDTTPEPDVEGGNKAEKEAL